MQTHPTISYPESEKSQLLQLKDLFEAWHAHFKENESVFQKSTIDNFNFDGFYPWYFSQELRILFVGRESRGTRDSHIIDELFDSYHDKMVGGHSLNRSKMHSRMIYIAYGLLHHMPVWQDIPYATELGGLVGTPDGFSFAFMNISKLSKESAGYQADMETIGASVHLSGQVRRFNEEEVAILKPHLVISMNLGGHMCSLGRIEDIGPEGSANVHWLHSGGHRALLVNTYHFAAVRWVNDIRDFYEPICRAVKKHLPSIG